MAAWKRAEETMETSHQQPTVKRIVQEPTDMEDPSVRFDEIVKQCTKPADHNTLATEKGETALASSLSVLKRLKDDGCDLIGSIEASSASRTGRHLAQRTATEAECNALSEESSVHVETVDVKLKVQWIEAFGNVAPHQLTSDIEEINKMTGDILNTQQELINRLRDEVNFAEQTVQLEMERQTEDLGVMRKRMKDHLDSTRASQRCQLGEIDAAFEEDYNLLLTGHSSQMDQMLAEWSATEDKILHELDEIGDRLAADLIQTDAHYYKECSRTRNNLTDDIHLIERELEKLKTSFALNNEVLDYNCRVLKLREEERASLITRHKRKINRLTDRYKQLKEESDKINKMHRDEELKRVKQFEHLKHDCDSMERKFSIIKTANDRQLESVCQLAEDRICELLKKLAGIDERIFVEILEQPWDGLVGVSHHIEPNSTHMSASETNEVIDRLEKNLKFLTETVQDVENTKERLMKVLDIPDEHEFRLLLKTMQTVPDSDIMKELACYIHQQRARPADQPATSRRYLVDPVTIRAHFSLFKETAVPKSRLDMWKMLAKALIQYERILRDRLTAAAEVLALTKAAQ